MVVLILSMSGLIIGWGRSWNLPCVRMDLMPGPIGAYAGKDLLSRPIGIDLEPKSMGVFPVLGLD